MAALHLGALPAQPRLSAFIRRFNLTSPGEELALPREALPRMLAGLRTVEISQRPIELLRSIALMSEVPGQRMSLMPAIDYPLAWAVTAEELAYHADALESWGLIAIPIRQLDGRLEVVVTHEGWQEAAKGSFKEATTAFVAMSFSQEMTSLWTDAIRPAIAAAGYMPKRVDTDAHLGRIDLKILADIRAAKFVVCDVTEQKQGVYFEAGFSLALDKPVIWTVRRNEIRQVHFDTRQFSHILWDDDEDLKDQLTLVIRGVIGQGPVATE
jgi:hypothetical protein